MEWVTQIGSALASPAGVLILLAGIGYTGYLGIWRWKRELDREKEENVFLRSLVKKLAGVQEKQTENLDRAVTLAEVRAEVLRGGGE